MRVIFLLIIWAAPYLTHADTSQFQPSEKIQQKDNCPTNVVIYKTKSGMEIPLDLNKVGIGAEISKFGSDFVFKTIAPNGSTDKSKAINVGDRIISISQNDDGSFTSVESMKLEELISEIRGCEGTRLQLMVKRAESEFNVSIVRGPLPR